MVDFNNLELHRFPDIGVIIPDWLDIDLRSGEESFDTKNINYHPAFCTALNISFYYFIIVQRGIDPVP